MQLLVHKNISFCLAQKRYQPGKSSGKKPLKLIKTTPSTNIQPTFNQHLFPVKQNGGFLK
jgi:hypothetical protein